MTSELLSSANREKELLDMFDKLVIAFYKSTDLHEALSNLNDLVAIEAELRNKHGYSFAKINQLPVDNQKNSLLPYSETKIGEYDLYLTPMQLPQEVVSLMKDTGYYELFVNNVDNIFFVMNREALENVFFNKTVAGTIEPRTRSVFVSSKGIHRRSPAEVAALLIHESFHIHTYADYMFVFQGEYAAARYELGYWKKISDLPDMPETFKQEAQRNIASLSAFIQRMSSN